LNWFSIDLVSFYMFWDETEIGRGIV
jgi:hypothetical protein